MNLDDLSLYAKIDPQNMIAQIDSLPDQLAQAWARGQSQPLPAPAWKNIQRIVISGMGGSAIGADLLAAYVQSSCAVPVIVHRDYGLPAFARGSETLVIASSHSGNTEETLESLEAAIKNNCRVIAICTGGKLAERVESINAPVWKFDHKGQPRAAVGFSFGLLLALFARLDLIPDPSADLREAIGALKAMQKRINVESPVSENSAKRLAGQMMERIVTVMGAGILAPVARRWKGQFNELAKTMAVFEFLPEADHNTLQGTMFPEEALPTRTATIFLRAKSLHPRHSARLELTRSTYMLEGLNTDFVIAEGESALAQMWTALLFGDYVSYYLAIAYGIDPTPIPALENFKVALKEMK
jgi:glucose/mannose-6-phosphate isomerase